MKYFYEYKIKNGAKVGGHNLEKIIVKDDVIILEGVDTLMDYDGEYDRHWRSIINEVKIEYLKIEPMEDEENKPIIEKISRLNYQQIGTYQLDNNDTLGFIKALNEQLTKHGRKLNEVIDYLNRKEDKNN